MKKGILIVLGTLFGITILISGCNKSEEKKAETPSVEKQMVEEKAPAMKPEMAEETEQEAETATEKTENITEQAVGAAKEMGQQTMESIIEKMPEEVKQSGGDEMEKAAD